jgi:hypothetical protein
MKKLEWRALPGGVLAYGDTGYEIRMQSDPQKDPYIALDPEGRRMHIGGDVLGYMKKEVEYAAAARAEFTCSSDNGDER